MLLHHCTGSRSVRAVWTLEEMGLAYELKSWPFPPRWRAKDYLAVNPLGTVPYLIDGETRMTESTGICHYLVEKYGPTPLRVGPEEADYGLYLNWLYFSDATLTFPQTLVLRYRQLEPEERRVPQAADDYEKWFAGRLSAVARRAEEAEYLAADRFTIADIAVGYALQLATHLDLQHHFSPAVSAYFARLQARPAFQRAIAA